MAGRGSRVVVEGVPAMSLGYQRVESHRVAPGANTDGSSGAIPAGTRYAWVYVESGSVYVAQGAATDIATGTSGANLGNTVCLPSGGVAWSIDDPAEGDTFLHVRPTEAVNVEISFIRDAD